MYETSNMTAFFNNLYTIGDVLTALVYRPPRLEAANYAWLDTMVWAALVDRVGAQVMGMDPNMLLDRWVNMALLGDLTILNVWCI